LKKISWHVEKGGTGKTTMTGNIGYKLQTFGNVLLVDLDPQGNLSSWYLTGKFRWEAVDVLQKNCAPHDAVLKIRNNLHIMPTFAIGGSLKEWSETTLAHKPFVFRDFFRDLEKLNFDYCLTDLGPGISLLEKSVLACMDEICPTVNAEFFSVDGIEIAEHELGRIREDWHANFKVNKLVLNRLNESFVIHKTYWDALSRGKYKIYPVHQSTALSDCVPEHIAVFEYNLAPQRTTEELDSIAAAVRNGG